MDVRVEHEQGRVPITVFYVQGQVNMGSVGQLEQMARAEYDQGMRNLLIDLSEVSSLTSAGEDQLEAAPEARAPPQDRAPAAPSRSSSPWASPPRAARAARRCRPSGGRTRPASRRPPSRPCRSPSRP